MPGDLPSSDFSGRGPFTAPNALGVRRRLSPEPHEQPLRYGHPRHDPSNADRRGPSSLALFSVMAAVLAFPKTGLSHCMEIRLGNPLLFKKLGIWVSPKVLGSMCSSPNWCSTALLSVLPSALLRRGPRRPETERPHASDDAKQTRGVGCQSYLRPGSV